MRQPPTSIPPSGPRVAQARMAPMTGGAAPAPPGWMEPPQPYMPPQSPQPPQPRQTPKPAKRGRSKITNGLVALSSAAILSVYAVGYTHTQSADAQAGGAAPPANVVAAQGIPPTATVAFTPTVAGGNGGYFLLASSTPTASAAPALNAAPAVATVAPTAAAPTIAPPAATAPTVVPPRAPAIVLPTVAPTTVPTRAAVATPTPAPHPTATSPAAAVMGKYRDGSYTGTGTSRRGDIEVLVVVQGGKITSAEITQCGTSYSCTRIAALPGQVVAKQSANVNNVSRATYSTQAYQGAVADALTQATP